MAHPKKAHHFVSADRARPHDLDSLVLCAQWLFHARTGQLFHARELRQRRGDARGNAANLMIFELRGGRRASSRLSDERIRNVLDARILEMGESEPS